MDMIDTILGKIISILIILTGSLALLLGLIRGDPNYHIHTIVWDYQPWAVVIGIFIICAGFVVTIFGADYYSPKIIRKDFGIFLEFPKNGTRGRLPFTIRGTLKITPSSGVRIWLFTESQPPGGHYWPQSEIHIAGKRWTYTIRDKDSFQGVVLHCRLFALTSDGEKFLRLYFEMNDCRAEGDWPPIKSLPGCIRPCSDWMSFEFIKNPISPTFDG